MRRILILVAVGIAFGVAILLVLRALDVSEELAGLLGAFFGPALAIFVGSKAFKT